MARELAVEFERPFARGPTIAPAFRVPIEGGGVTALFGPSGCGKSTVLRCLAGVEWPASGEIRFGDEVWFDARTRVPPQKRRVGYVAQADSLFPHLSVAANVGYGVPRGERAAAVARMMDLMEIGEWAERLPGELSGGQRQRVAMARALAPRPRLLLLDEPFSALDVPAREDSRRRVRRLLASLEVPTILVTHDRADVLATADRVVVMNAGRVRQVGAVPEVFSRPAGADVAAIVGVETVVEGRVVETWAGLATVEVGSAQLTAVNPAELHGPVLVCVRGEEVVLRTAEEPGRDSARNHLRGRITAMHDEGPLVRIGIDCGFGLQALVTRASCAEMGLREGGAVVAAVKAPAVHLIAR